jgi:hypothetical protein
MILAEVKRTAEAGTTTLGESWAPRKKDGARALVHAATHITVKTSGSVVTLVIRGPDAIHNDGNLPHTPARRILPDYSNLSPPILAILQKVSADLFEEIMT